MAQRLLRIEHREYCVTLLCFISELWNMRVLLCVRPVMHFILFVQSIIWPTSPCVRAQAMGLALDISRLYVWASFAVDESMCITDMGKGESEFLLAHFRQFLTCIPPAIAFFWNSICPHWVDATGFWLYAASWTMWHQFLSEFFLEMPWKWELQMHSQISDAVNCVIVKYAWLRLFVGKVYRKNFQLHLVIRLHFHRKRAEG